MVRKTDIQRDAALALTKSGWTASQIASALGITDRTVRRFREEARARCLEVRSDCRSLEALLADAD
jgi:predicted transcriptional regulator